MPSQYAILELFPAPGEWTEDDYYFLDDRGRLVELADGNVEVLPRPTLEHALVVMRLVSSLFGYTTEKKVGALSMAPLPVTLWPGRICEPDLIFMLPEHYYRIDKYWGVPDLVVEVTMAETRERDRGVKRADCERAGVQEYWIIDPEFKTAEIIRFGEETRLLSAGDTLTSPFFPRWSYNLSDLFAPED